MNWQFGFVVEAVCSDSVVELVVNKLVVEDTLVVVEHLTVFVAQSKVNVVQMIVVKHAIVLVAKDMAGFVEYTIVLVAEYMIVVVASKSIVV